MQAVVLAAGRSTRTYPLTLTRPKPLLPVLDRTILERNLAALEGVCREAILVVGYRGDMIRSHVGERFGSLTISYVEQGEPRGTGHALQAAEPLLGDRFLVLNGDDLFAAADLRALAAHETGVLATEVEDVRRFGAVAAAGGRLQAIEEKPARGGPGLVNTGAYVLPHRAVAEDVAPSARGEIEIVAFVNRAAREGAVACIRAAGPWRPVSYPWSYLEASVAVLREMAASRVDETAIVEPGVTIEGRVAIGPRSRVRAGTVLEGPVYIGADCVVGPHAYLRADTVLLDGARVRGEVVDAVLMAGVTAKHACYVGHSVIGERVNVGAGTITADYRHDGGSNWSLVNGRKVDSGRRKLGAFVGDDVRLGIGTLLYPGRKIWPGRSTLPGQIVREDIVG